MADTVWKSLDSAPRAGTDGKPVPVLLFLPTAWHETDREGRPTKAEHARVIGWWDDHQQAWLMGINPKSPVVTVYPSLWTALPDPPEIP